MAYFHTTVLDNQIKALPTVDTASGSVATFDTDMTENLIEVKCQIVAQQSGSGTPSPDNERPITVYNDLNLIHVGNTDKMSILNGIVDGSYDLIDLGDLNWAYGGDGLFTSSTIPNPKARGEDFLITNLYTNSGIKISSDMPDMTLQLTMINQIWVKNSNYTDGTIFKNAMSGVCIAFELANAISPTTYKASSFNALLSAYNISGSAYNIPFGQTVANGVLDVTTGVLEITHGVVKMADLVWVSSESIFVNRLSDGDLHTAARGSTNYCEIYRSSGFSSSTGMTDKSIQTMGGGGSANFWCKDTDYTTASDFINSLGDYKLVYPLATPIGIQLDSITLQALLNENNIWCDTGDTEVKYLLTVGKKIS